MAYVQTDQGFTAVMATCVEDKKERPIVFRRGDEIYAGDTDISGGARFQVISKSIQITDIEGINLDGAKTSIIMDAWASNNQRCTLSLRVLDCAQPIFLSFQKAGICTRPVKTPWSVALIRRFDK